MSQLDRAAQAAAAAADHARVRVVEVEGIGDLRRISDLFASVWGHTPEGVPVSSEMMRSLVHAGGLVSLALAPDSGDAIGAAVLGRAEPGACYSFIAAATVGFADRGVGFALKQHQRAWALARGMSRMDWTFDPLVGRNARFNLTKLGARVRRYEPEFYGRMSDALNGADVADRMVAEWRLDSPVVERAALGGFDEPVEPTPAEHVEVGPDGLPAYAATADLRWCRVPADIVALRREAPGLASQWRAVTRAWLMASLSDGYVAVGASRQGWYRLEKENE